MEEPLGEGHKLTFRGQGLRQGGVPRANLVVATLQRG